MSTHIFFMNQNNKEHNKFRRNAPIDGISGRPPARFNQGGSASSFGTPSRSGRPDRPAQQPNMLNDFRRPDGFHTTRQQQIRQNIPQQETVVIDRKDTKKQRSWFRRKKNPNDLSSNKKKPLTKKQKILRISAVVLIILAIIIGVLFAKGYLTLRKILPGGGGAAALQQNVDPSKLRGEGDGRVNILLLGRGGEGHEGADLTDTIIIASIDPIAKEAALVSIPRGLYVPVEDFGSMKVNSVFATGKSLAQSNSGNIKTGNDQQYEAEGFKLLEKTLETNLGIPMHYHAMVDFQGFKEAVDTVGGVSFNAPKSVTETLRIDGQNYYLNA